MDHRHSRLSRLYHQGIEAATVRHLSPQYLYASRPVRHRPRCL
ncbi:hypothetical protein [Lysobacter gummosus]